MIKNRVAIAENLKRLLIESSPLIEEYTAAVCPDCAEVCCKQRHGMYQERDIRYVQALGDTVPCRDTMRPPDGPCEAMGPYGCVQPRWMRPFKCTWFFCEPLLAALNSSPPKKVRRLSAALQEMCSLYGELEG